MINAAPTDLTGKTCLITGAFGGIGASVVEHFSALGATVYATDISETYSGDAIYRQFDLIDEYFKYDCVFSSEYFSVSK